MSDLTEWDTEIKPILERLKWDSMCLRSDAAMLRTRPAWETMTEEHVAIARKEIEAALDRIRMAQAVYRGKPVMAEQPIVLEGAV